MNGDETREPGSDDALIASMTNDTADGTGEASPGDATVPSGAAGAAGRSLSASMRPGKDGTVRRSRYYAALGILAATSILCGLLSWALASRRDGSPFSSTTALSYPMTAILDRDGNLVTSDSGYRRVLKIAPDGTMLARIDGSAVEGGYYEGNVLGADSSGRIYVDDTVLSPGSGEPVLERIVRFGPDGRWLDEPLRIEFDEETRGDYAWRLLFAQMRGDRLFWFFPDERSTDEETAWSLHSIDFGQPGEPLRSSVRLEGVDVYSYLGAAVASLDRVWFLGYDGSIETLAPDGRAIGLYGNEDGLFRFPSGITCDQSGNPAVLDGKRRVWILDADAATPEPRLVLDPVTLATAGYAGLPSLFRLSFSASGAISAADERSGRALVHEPGKPVRSFAEALLPTPEIALRLAAWIAPALAILAAAAFLVLVYVRVLSRKTRLLYKQIAIFSPLVALSLLAISSITFSSLYEMYATQVEGRLRNLSQAGASMIDGASVDELDFGSLTLGQIQEREGYAEIVRVLDRLVNRNEDSWNAGVFPYLYVPSGDGWYIVGSFDYVEPFPYDKDAYREVMDTGKMVYARYDDVYGSWISALSPVVGGDGDPVAVFEASMSENAFREYADGFTTRAVAGTAALVVLVIAMFVVFNAALLRSIRSLQHGTRKIAGGDYDVNVDIRTRDEIEDLGAAFNTMSREIKRYVGRITAINKASAHFVPNEFIRLLGREAIEDIRRGDHARREMTVLFSDIRDFTALSESMSPDDIFRLINEYLEAVGPAIRKRGGFIDKYLGDGIMALFPESADSALLAVADMYRALEDFNRRRVRGAAGPLRVGYGAHSGTLALGIVGEEERFDGTVVSDAVNLASRLESLTKFYGTGALVTAKTYSSLERPELFSIRFVDSARVKGRSQPVSIYEFVLPDDPDRDSKVALAPLYKQAHEAYSSGGFREAAAMFGKLIERCPRDPIVAVMADRCARFTTSGPPPGWDGVMEFHEK